MLFIEFEKLELTGGHFEIMLLVEINKIELTFGHIEIMLFIEIERLEFDSSVTILKLCYL